MPNTNNHQVIRGRGPSVTVRPSPSQPTDYPSQLASIARISQTQDAFNTQAFESWYHEYLNSPATGPRPQTDQWFVTWTGLTPELVPVHSGSATKQEAIANALRSNKTEIRNMLRMVNNYMDAVGVYNKRAERLTSLASETT